MPASPLVHGMSATPDEMAEARRWAAERFGGGREANPPFSFKYGGRHWAELLKAWEGRQASQRLDVQRTEYTLTWTDPETGLAVRCVAVEYHGFPTVEWTLYFKNAGPSDTLILEDIQALDARVEHKTDAGVVLHHHTGSPCKPYDYQPHRTPLGGRWSEKEELITTSGGRPSDSDFPYFNLEWPGEGLIVVVGWPGQWSARFTAEAEGRVRIRAGQELTRFMLHPGEEVRSPLIVMQFWKGDRIRAQNIWRRWMLAHNVPRPGGKLPPTHLAACSSHQFGEMIHADEASQITFIDRYLAEGVKLDYWWMDAGWYPNKTGWPNTGTWEVDKTRFPRGLRAITDHARSKGVNSIVWFEPERVTPGTWLYENHPEWLLGRDGQQKLLNLGVPAAREWLTEHVDKLLREEGIALYRQDFNMAPLPFWRANDAQDRQGITETRHVTGYLAYWDELRRRHPDMLIDTCASGGRRNDIETLRRSVPLLRSDYILEPVGQQCHTYGISHWLPYYGTGINSFDPYVFRSQMCPLLNACYDVRKQDSDYAALRRLHEQWKAIAEYYLGDYYPLTSYSLENDVWMAWQFDRPDLGEGVVQVFRRAGSPYETASFKLHGLAPDARYTVRNSDAEGATDMTGRDLMEKGLPVALPNRPQAVVFTYAKAGGGAER